AVQTLSKRGLWEARNVGTALPDVWTEGRREPAHHGRDGEARCIHRQRRAGEGEGQGRPGVYRAAVATRGGKETRLHRGLNGTGSATCPGSSAGGRHPAGFGCTAGKAGSAT